MWPRVQRVGRVARNGLAVVGFGTLAMSAARDAASKKKATLPDRFILDLDLEKGALAEAPVTDPLKKLLGGKKAAGLLPMQDVVRAMDKASGDERVKVLQCRMGGDSSPGGFAQVQELRDAVLRFRLRTGGRIPTMVHAMSFGEGGNGTSSYYLASAFQDVTVHPTGMLNLVGLASQQPFLRGLLDKWGVAPLFFQRREYKNMANMFTESGFTEPHKRALAGIIFDMGDQVMAGIAEARGLPLKQVRKLVDNAPLSVQEAAQAGLISGGQYRDGLEEAAESVAAAPSGPSEELGAPCTKKVPRISMARYIAAIQAEEARAKTAKRFTAEGLREWAEDTLAAAREVTSSASGSGAPDPSAAAPPPKNPAVGVIYATGQIAVGSSDDDGVNRGDSVRSASLIKLLREARDDNDLRAVVLRVDSPGGSALASDAIHREIQLLRDAGKFVIASMGNVAASGGYYISAPASKIMAEPGTITGSIGVIFGKLDVERFLSERGVTVETIAVGKNATAFAPIGGFTKDQVKKVDAMVDRTYDQFKGVVAAGRGLKLKAVEQVAKGRVWTGAQAKELGLVDDLGGVGDAIRAAQAHVAEEARGEKGEKGRKPLEAADVEVRVVVEKVGLKEVLAKLTGEDSDASLSLSAVAAAAAAGGLPAEWLLALAATGVLGAGGGGGAVAGAKAAMGAAGLGPGVQVYSHDAVALAGSLA